MVAGVSLWAAQGCWGQFKQQHPDADGFVEDLFKQREKNRRSDRTTRLRLGWNNNMMHLWVVNTSLLWLLWKMTLLRCKNIVTAALIHFFVFQQNNSNIYKRIVVKFSGTVENEQRKRCLHFGDVLIHHPDPGMFGKIVYHCHFQHMHASPKALELWSYKYNSQFVSSDPQDPPRMPATLAAASRLRPRKPKDDFPKKSTRF